MLVAPTPRGSARSVAGSVVVARVLRPADRDTRAGRPFHRAPLPTAPAEFRHEHSPAGPVAHGGARKQNPTSRSVPEGKCYGLRNDTVSRAPGETRAKRGARAPAPSGRRRRVNRQSNGRANRQSNGRANRQSNARGNLRGARGAGTTADAEQPTARTGSSWRRVSGARRTGGSSVSMAVRYPDGSSPPPAAGDARRGPQQPRIVLYTPDRAGYGMRNITVSRAP